MTEGKVDVFITDSNPVRAVVLSGWARKGRSFEDYTFLVKDVTWDEAKAIVKLYNFGEEQ